MSPGPIAVIGAGGHAKVVVATLLAAGHESIEIYDDDPAKHGQRILGVPVCGSVAELASGSPRPAVLALGDNRLRQKLDRELKLEWISVVHPAASVDPTARIGAGSVVFAGVVIQADTVVGRHTIVNTSASVDHDGHLDDYCHVAPGAHLAGTVSVGTGALLGVGCSVLPGVQIGEWAVVGGGAAVVSDVAPQEVVGGVPARPLTSRTESESS